MLPAAIPNLVVNGTTGIAVGMATNMAPHNLVEVVQALRHLIRHPDTDIDGLMRFVPGPDLPTGGKIIGLDGIRDAYETGRGSFRMRATARVETRRAAQGHRGHRAAVRRGHREGRRADQDAGPGQEAPGHLRRQGPHRHGQRHSAWSSRSRTASSPRRSSSSSTSRPRWRSPSASTTSAWSTASRARSGLKELLEVFLGHRYDVVRRRSMFRRDKKADRLHLVDGLLIALLDIDEVIQVIRTSDDAATARERLMSVFDLSEAQADYILDMQLRRLTRFSRIELEKEQETLRREIEELEAILADEAAAQEGRLRRAGRGRQDLRHPAPHGPARVRRHHGHRDRRAARGRPTTRASRSSPPAACSPARPPTSPSARAATAPTTTWSSPRCRRRPAARSAWSPPAAGCSSCRVLDLPGLPAVGQRPEPPGRLPGQRAGLAGARRAGARAEPARHRRARASRSAPATAWSSGSTPRCSARDEWEVIRLDDGDEVVGADRAGHRHRDALLHHHRRPAAALRRRAVRPQGRVRRRHRRRPASPPASGSRGSAP